MTTLQEIEAREAELERLRQENQAIASRSVPVRRFGAGVSPQDQRQVVQQRQVAQNNLAEIQRQGQELQNIREQIQREESERARVQEEIAQYNAARKVASRGGRKLNSTQLKALGFSKRAQEFYNDIYEGNQSTARYIDSIKRSQEQGLTPIIQKGKIVGFLDEKRQQSISIEGAGRLAQENPEFRSRLQAAGIIENNPTALEELKQQSLRPEIRNQPLSQRPVSSISATPPPTGGFLERNLQSVERRRSEITSDISRGQSAIQSQVSGFTSVGLGFVSGGLKQVIFAKNLVIKPLTTTKSLFLGFKGVGTKIITGEGFPEIGKSIASNPGGAIGETTAFLVTPLAATKLTTFTIDVGRTFRLSELPAESIIAPEFFRGQTYPGIRKGQTAAELLAEFKPLLPGEIKPAGFTAAPKPLPKQTSVLRGTSELPGLYQAPRVSPKFLGISGEGEKIFSLSPLPTTRPTIVRLTPQEIKLTSLVRPGQKTLASRAATKEFFETAPKGKSFIPFIKTEKEAVIPFDTGVELTAKRFFIKFEGRRVPILEFKTIDTIIPEKSNIKVQTIKEISLYSYKPSKKSLFDPLDITSLASASRSRSTSSTASFAASSYSLPSSSLTSLGSSPSPSSSIAYSPLVSSPFRSRGSSLILYGSPSLPSLPKTPGTPIFPSSSTRNYNFSRKKIDNRITVEGYRTFVIARGKKTFLPGIRPRGKALRKGELVATQTLRATFGIEASPIKVTEKDLRFVPSKSFRGYRIKQGKQIPLINQFIQKRGTRLSSSGERRDITLARLRLL